MNPGARGALFLRIQDADTFLSTPQISKLRISRVLKRVLWAVGGFGETRR